MFFEIIAELARGRRLLLFHSDDLNKQITDTDDYKTKLKNFVRAHGQPPLSIQGAEAAPVSTGDQLSPLRYKLALTKSKIWTLAYVYRYYAAP